MEAFLNPNLNRAPSYLSSLEGLRSGAELRVRLGLRLRVRSVGLLVIYFLLASGMARGASTPEVGRKDAVIVDEKTEAVIKAALKYLASKQNPNGSWAASEDEQRHPIAITGYTLMAFQAAGQLPGEG